MSEQEQMAPDEPPTTARDPLPGKPLGELVVPVCGAPDELLKHRFLCRGGGCLLIAPTGVGKTVATLQAGISWSVGKAFAGIEPARALTVWLFTAEDNEGDIAVERDGIFSGLRQHGVLSADECTEARARVRIITELGLAGVDFGDFLREALQGARDADQLPDLLIIDPVLDFLGGDANSQSDVSTFLRRILGPILVEFEAGALIVHHCGKPPSSNQRGARGTPDFTYIGFGSSEWSNWPRSILALVKTEIRGLLVLHACKNGHKLRWRDPDTGEPVYERHLAHAADERIYERHLAHAADERIYWREPSPVEVAMALAGNRRTSSARRSATVEDVVRLADVPRGKSDFKERVQSGLGIGRDNAQGLIKACVERGMLEEVRLRVYPTGMLIGLPGVTSAEAARLNAQGSRDGNASAVLPVGAVPPAAAGSAQQPGYPLLQL